MKCATFWDFFFSTRTYFYPGNENTQIKQCRKHRQAGSKLTDSAAMRCAAGERALLHQDAVCGTARQVRREMGVIKLILVGGGWGKGEGGSWRGK